MVFSFKKLVADDHCLPRFEVQIKSFGYFLN